MTGFFGQMRSPILRLVLARLRSRPRAQRLTIDWRRGSDSRSPGDPDLRDGHVAPRSPPLRREPRCPLTLELFCDPVTAADGHTYERVAIEEWLATGSRTSPSTGQPLQSTALIPQFTVKRLVVAFMETRRSSVDEDVS